jgi:hypothetical protein
MARTSTPDNAMMRKQRDADLGPPQEDGALDEKTERIEESVRANKGISQAREDRGLDGSETERVLKRAVENEGRTGR